MSNQSFNQFAGQPAPAPVNPGFQQPGTPAQQPGTPGQQGFTGAPPPMQGPPMGPPQGAPAWPNQPAPQGAPVQAPMQQYAPAQVPQQYAPPMQQPAPVPSYPAALPQQAAPHQAFAAPPQAFGAPSAFGAGAFGAAKIMGDKLPCAPGLYRMRVADTGQRRDPKTGLPYWRLKCTVVQAFSGAQPVGSDVTTSQGLTGDQQIQYAGSFFLQLGAACLGVNNEAELKALLNQKYGTFQAQNGLLLDGWAQFADALQNATQQVNNCPPNPLAGTEFIVEVIPTQGKGANANKMFEKWQALRRVQA